MVSLERNKVYNKHTLEKKFGEFNLEIDETELLIDNGDDVFIRIEISQLPHCCGAEELGNFQCNSEEHHEVLKYGIKKLTSVLKKSGMVFLVTCVDNTHYFDAFSHFDDWEPIKNWRNPNSGNHLTMFMLK